MIDWCTDREFAMVWNRNSDAAGVSAALRDDVAAPAAQLDEPVLLKIRHTSRPDRTRSLPMLRFDPRHEDFGPQPALDLLRVGTFQEQLDSLPQVGGCSSTVAP
jgi:hypothetical protein